MTHEETVNHEKEVALLYKRIELNAERRVNETRKRLESDFAPMFSRLPARRSPVSQETGEALLARLYEIVDLFESSGIHVAK